MVAIVEDSFYAGQFQVECRQCDIVVTRGHYVKLDAAKRLEFAHKALFHN